MTSSNASQKMRRKFHKMRNIVNLCESSIVEPLVNYPELCFPVESANSTKIKITHNRVIGEGCIWEGVSFRNP